MNYDFKQFANLPIQKKKVQWHRQFIYLIDKHAVDYNFTSVLCSHKSYHMVHLESLWLLTYGKIEYDQNWIL